MQAAQATGKLMLLIFVKSGKVLAVIAIACLSLAMLTGCLESTTEYVVLERRADIHIFENYLDEIRRVGKADDFHFIGLENEYWAKVSKFNRNTIKSIRFEAGRVVLTNETFGFQIVFEPKQDVGITTWTCQIVDSSLFFHPQECASWKKNINDQ
jgi:hypothetical protein